MSNWKGEFNLAAGAEEEIEPTGAEVVSAWGDEGDTGTAAFVSPEGTACDAARERKDRVFAGFLRTGAVVAPLATFSSDERWGMLTALVEPEEEVSEGWDSCTWEAC